MNNVIDAAENDTANTVTRDLEWPDMALFAKKKMMESLRNLEDRIGANANNNQDDTENEIKYTERKTFREAWYHPDPIQRKMWREAI